MLSQMSNPRKMQQQQEMEFLRDFDLLTKIAPGQETLYSMADLEKGNQMMKQTFVLKEDGTPYTMKSHINEFKRFGPGIFLLFKFLKYLSVLFGVVSLFSISSIFVLLLGENPNHSFVGSSFRSGILKTTIYRLSQTSFNPYVGLHFVISVIFGVFFVYWREKEKFYVIQCLKIATLASYSTVHVKDKTQRFSENDLAVYFNSEFGEIAQIYTVKSFGEDILKYQQINELVKNYKQQKALTEIEQDRDCCKLTSLFLKFRQEHFGLKKIIQQSQNYKACYTFVRFKKIEDRQKLIAFETKKKFLCCLKSEKAPHDSDSETSNVDIRKLKIKQCEMQPNGIVWQNLHLSKSSKAIKIGTVLFLLLIVLTISCFLIFLLSIMQMSVSNSKFKDFNRQDLIGLNDEFALLSYCVNLSFSQFYTQYDICSNYYSQYVKLTIMMLLIPVSISLFKFILTQIMTALLHFRRYAYEISKIQSQATIIFIFYFLVTGPFQLFVYLGSEHSSFFKIFTPILKAIINSDFDPSKISLFTDYVPDWYVLSSSNIFMIGAMSFNLSAVGIIFYCFIRSKIFQRIGMRQKIQIQMNSWLEGYKLQIEYVYGAILTIVYFTLLFGGSMPLLYPLAFVSFLILFWSYKYVFIKFCIKPLVFNHSVNRRVSKIMFGALVMHCIFTPIFYRASGIANFQKVQSFVERIFSLWYYFILLLAICLYLTLDKPIRIFYPIITQYFQNQNQKQNQKYPTLDENIPKPQIQHARRHLKLPTIVKRRHNWLNSESYSMHECPLYKQILKTLYVIDNNERDRKSFALNANLCFLYQNKSKPNNFNSKALNDVIQLVQRDFKKYSHKYKQQANNPYFQNKKKLYQIYSNSKNKPVKKYTLFLSGESGFKQMESGDGFLQHGDENIICSQGNTKEEEISDQMTSNIQSHQKNKSSEISQDIEQSSEVSEVSVKTDEINTQKSRASSIKASIENDLCSNGNVEIAQQSQDRLHDSKL